MPHDENRAESRIQGSGETRQDRLWTLIQARKEMPPEHESASPVPAFGDSHADAVLVDALIEAVRNQPSTAADGAHGRSLLQRAIAMDVAGRAPRTAARQSPFATGQAVVSAGHTPARRSFLRLSGRRQLVLAMALLLITAAAIAYIVSSARTPGCATIGPDAPSSGVALASPLPQPVPLRSKQASRGSGQTPTATVPHKCE